VARMIKLEKFADSRGWSVNDVYREVRKRVSHQDPKTPYDKDVMSPYSYQINYSHIYPGIVKAWHRHKKQDDYFFVLHGMAQVGVYCEDTASAGGNPAKKYFIGEHNPALVHISAGEWHGITPIGSEPCGLLYFVTNEYNPQDPDEERASWTDFVGADWWFAEYK
jgi:dTDP-4-dehydrorhamnose 3,5-epimerase